MRSRRRGWLLLLKGLVSVSLLLWLGWRIFEREGVSALLDRVFTLDSSWLAVAVALHFVAIGFGVARWRLLLRSVAMELSPWWLARTYLIARFVGAFTPSTTGLDGWRLYEAGRRTGHMGRSAAAIGVEKLVGLVGMSVVCAALVPFGGVALMGSTALLVSAALGSVSVFALVVLGRPELLRRLLALVPRLLASRITKLVDALSAADLSTVTLCRAVALGVGSHLALSAVFMATARAVGVEASASTLLVVGNAIVLAVLLPVSIGGVGVREGVAVMLLASVSVGSADAVLVSLLGYLTGQLPALAGGAMMLFDAKPTAGSAPDLDNSPSMATRTALT